MTETQEQTQSRGRLLVVDDNAMYAINATRAVKARGYEVDVAFDLKDAINYLQSGNYVGVITDLQFCEEGVKRADAWGNLSDLEKSLLDRAKSKTDIKPNLDLRERIAKELATQDSVKQLKALDNKNCCKICVYGDFETRLREELMENPAMGYEVIRYAQEHNIPVAVVTSIDHGQHCIPALFQTGLASVDLLISHWDTLRRLRRSVAYPLDGSPDMVDPKLREQILEDTKAILLDQAILVECDKEQRTYDFAIDMLEGRIDQTRPYRVEA